MTVNRALAITLKPRFPVPRFDLPLFGDVWRGVVGKDAFDAGGGRGKARAEGFVHQ